MTNDAVFNAFSKGGAYTLPYLITVHHPLFGSLYYVNNNEDVSYNGQVYTASAFKYTRPQTIGGVLQNGTLEITGMQTRMIAIVEASDELFTVTVTGVLDAEGDITPVSFFHHQYGTVTVDTAQKITITFTNDDRLDMTFPPYMFDTDNNRGNA